MSPSAQAKFLRVLQEREFQRLGGTRVLRTDARIIAATNRDLPQSIERGHFREDLYYRLNVFAIHLPPLRERREDVLALSEAFLGEISQRPRPPARGHFARRARAAARLSLAGQRARAAERPRARRDPLRWRADSRRASRAVDAVPSAVTSVTRPIGSVDVWRRPDQLCRPTGHAGALGKRHPIDGAHDDREGASGLAVQQVEGGRDPRTDQSAALRTDASLRVGLSLLSS